MKSNLTDVNKEELLIIRKIEEKVKHIIEEEFDFSSSKDVFFTQSDGNILSISLSKLGLKNIPEELAGLKEVIRLSLSSNLLLEFPNVIMKMLKVSVLDLSQNQIAKIPNWIENLKLLRVLKLNSNQLFSLPKAIGSCKLLRKLFLQNNQIHSLPIELLELKLLEEIHLDFRTTMHKKTKGVLAQLESRGCKVRNDYNRR